MGGIALLTGFGPFGSYRRNPAEAVVSELHKSQLGCITVYGEFLPSIISPPYLLRLLKKPHSGIALNYNYS
jgi:pyrrolidone-carboxylate peptidase